jgi:hypothetical protein
MYSLHSIIFVEQTIFQHFPIGFCVEKHGELSRDQKNFFFNGYNPPTLYVLLFEI